MSKKRKPKILFYDIETTPLLAYVWRCGKQVVRHNQLAKQRNMYNIICITYCWNDGRAAKALTWDYDSQDCSKMIEEFDEIIKQADITIGKNSDRFDVKHINTQRFLTDGKPMPDWSEYTDDLEKQIRKHFYLPSFSLDFVSDMLGLGGKVKMEFQDWINIVEQNGSKGKTAFRKMVRYGKKDTEDTRKIWNKMSKHFKPKLNMATLLGNDELRCVHCGSKNLHKNGTKVKGKSKYQTFWCTDHGGYAGKAIIKKDKGFGKIG